MSIKFREATSQHYDGIRHLSRGIYGSTDTLVYSFIDRLKNDKWFQFVGETNQGNIIAFGAINITGASESMILRFGRIHKDYKGRGLSKAFISYGVRYIRERVQGARFVYRVQSVDIVVPDGYRVLKKMGLVVIPFNDNAKSYIEENDLIQSNIVVLTWPEFKVMFDSSCAVRKLFGHSTLEVGCDIFNLNCLANWSVLAEHVDTRILVSEYESKYCEKEIMISFLRLEKFWTNEDVPLMAMNVYGLNKRALKCHMVKGIIEASKYVGRERFVMKLYLGSEMMGDCGNIVKEICGCNAEYEVELYLLLCDLRIKPGSHL